MLYVSTNSLSPRRPYSGIQTLQHPAFVVSPAARFSSVVRQSGRTAEFWGSVLRIWASLKVAQIYISFQKRHRDEDWVKATWEKEHGKAGDVGVLSFIIYAFHQRHCFDHSIARTNQFVFVYVLSFYVEDGKALYRHEGAFESVNNLIGDVPK